MASRARKAGRMYQSAAATISNVTSKVTPIIIIILSGGGFVLLLFDGATLLASISAVLWTVAWWKAFYYWEHDTIPYFGTHPLMGKSVAAVVGAIVSAMSFFVVTLFSTDAALFEIGPQSLLLILFFVYFADFGYRVLEIISYEVTGGAGLSPGIKTVYFGLAILFVGFMTYQVALGGEWGNLAQVAGPAGSVTADVVTTVAETAATSTSYVINSITNSPGFIRMQCVLESGGLAGAAFTPSSQISKCVKEKLNRTEKSKEVTRPVELRLRNPRVRPDWRNDEVTVSIEAFNTLVTDIAGRPLTIPARNVRVTATWKWQNEIVAQKTRPKPTGSQYPVTVQNGNFDLFRFTFPLNRSTDDPEKARNGTIAVNVDGYTLTINGSYTFDAEAAFTDSSRWRTGDHTLKVWDYDAWVSRPLEFREDWTSTNCETIAFQDFEYSVQRTAALTTPIMPVMYTDCGNRLAQDAEDGGIAIDMSATRSTNKKSEVDVERFQIKEAMTDCGGSLQDLESKWGEVGSWTTEFIEAIGWDVTPYRVNRSVAIKGESTTISCFLNMSIRIGLGGVKQSGIAIRNETVG